MATRRSLPKRDSMARATASPAFSIRAGPGVPWTMVQASAARISSPVRMGRMGQRLASQTITMSAENANR